MEEKVFNSLKEKCEYYRSKTDTRLEKGLYTMVMLDGRSFSKLIKNKYELPFSDKFINIMNGTASYLCKKVQGCKMAFVQSDEISLVLTDFDSEKEKDVFFGGRIEKLLSIIPGLAAGYFNKATILENIDDKVSLCSTSDILKMIKAEEPVQFDAKIWQLDNLNDCIAWFLYRQLDCTRNSKQQHSRHYLSHKQVRGKTTDEQLELVKELNGIDWNTQYDDGKKFGRFIWKENVEVSPGVIRPTYSVHAGFELRKKEERDKFISLGIIPDIKNFRR